MNCKPGDLAVVVNAENQSNLGRVVTVLRRAAWTGLMRPDGSVEDGVVWETDRPGPSYDQSQIHPFFLDRQLRPIRDPGEDARDETLQWLPVPVREQEPA